MYIEERGGCALNPTRRLFLFGTMLDDPCELNVVKSTFLIDWGAMEHFVTFLFGESVKKVERI